MKLLIREFIPTDEAAIQRVAQAAAPATPLPEAGRFWDSPRQFQRWIAKWEGQVVAYADYTQSPNAACEFWVSIYVHPQAQGRGVGAALYTHLLNTLLPLGPLALRASLHPECAEAVRFLTARGYRVESQVRRPDGPPTGHVTFIKLFKSLREKEMAL